MGAVWRAHDELLGRDVAIKEIVWPPHTDPRELEIARRRAMREAQLTARLHHPNVTRVYDIIEEDDRTSIVMELVPYRSLREIVREDGPLSPTQAARVGLGVLAALRAAHEAGVVHRDVKPANILLGPEDRVILTDFGIAKAADSPALTESGVLIGSPSYTAPERARGERAGAPADLWALGASLYVAVEGRPPFDRDGALASLTAIVADEPDPPGHAGALWPVIAGLLGKDPSTRLGIAEAERMLLRVAEESDAARTAPFQAEPEAATGAISLPEPDVAADRPELDVAAERPEWDVAASWSEPDVAAGHPEAGEGAGGLAVAGEAGRSGPAGRRRYGAILAASVAVVAIAVIALAVALSSARTPGRQQAAAIPSAKASAAGQASASSAAATRGGTSNAVPTGYYRFTNSTGFSIGVPHGWQISYVGHYVYIRDPSDSAIFLLIDQSDQPQSDPLADWQQQAAARESTYPDYHLIRLAAVPYAQAEKAADWEFTYDRDGVQVQVLNRNVLANAHHAYALYWSTPVSDWNADYHFFQAFAATFQPASVNQA
jgi:tRNA A-37 threonylcarbamoyl transferase component Bud32